MKKLIAIFLLISVLVNAQEDKFIAKIIEFQPNKIVYTFGNNVKLRSEPNTSSKTILKLPIAKKLTILEKSKEKTLYNGIEWNWYKVNYNNKIGYVLGGLLSQETKTIDDDTYLTSFQKDRKLKVLIRLANGNQYTECVNNYRELFTIDVFDNRGIPNVKNMVYLNYHGEACGKDSGGCYYFNDGKKLIKAIELAQIGDGGYWFTEEVIFPNDKKSYWENKIYFEREKGGPVGEDYMKTKSQKETCIFQWQGKEMILESTLKD